MKEERKSNYKKGRNIEVFRYQRLISASVMLWPVMYLFYQSRGLSFTEIALIQSIGSLFTLIIEVPTGILSDRIGCKPILRIGAWFGFLASLVLYFSHDFYMFIAAELCFSISFASFSGADVALLYNTLKIERNEDSYINIMSKIRGQQSIIRLLTRIIAAYLFGLNSDSPVILTTISFLAVCFTIEYYYEKKAKSVGVNVISTELFKIEVIVNLFKKHRIFLILSLISLIMMTPISNYMAFLGPFLSSRGLIVGYFGLVQGVGSLFDYFGTKTSTLIEKNPSKNLFRIATVILLLILISGISRNLITLIIIYALFSFFQSPYQIVIGDLINKSVSDDNRATMLSISNMIDEVSTIIMDPIIGISLDNLGFGRVYIIIAVIGLTLIHLVRIVLYYSNRIDAEVQYEVTA